PDACWQQFQKRAEILRVEALGSRELPQHRSELLAELEHPGCEEPLDRLAGTGKLAPMRRKPRALDREHEVVRRLVAPAAKARGLLRAVERAVDLDRGQLSAGVFELARLRQTLGIERPAPRRERPAADADADFGHAENPRSHA